MMANYEDQRCTGVDSSMEGIATPYRNRAQTDVVCELHEVIDALCEKYRDEPLLIARLRQQVCHALPTTLETYRQMQINRDEMRRSTAASMNAMVNKCMVSTDYYYSPTTETFFVYDGVNYTTASQERVMKHIYTILTKEDAIGVSTKHRVIRMVVKELKRRNVVNTIPESVTIQNVFALFLGESDGSVSKNMVKYFLTTIGDCILKKNTSISYFLSPCMKPFMRELSNRCYEYLGCDVLKRFKYKYRDHALPECRLLRPLCYRTEQLEHVRASTSGAALNLLCVAAHYSTRYTSGDNFLHTKSFDHKLCSYVNYLREKNDVSQIIDEFVRTMLEVTDDANPATLTTKDMIFLWKRFCERECLPSTVFQLQLRQALALRFVYDDGSECFRGVTSQYAPLVCEFLKFWTECSAPADGGFETETEYEIEEVCAMFRGWLTRRNSFSVTEALLIEIIKHFHEDTVVVQDDKYIHGVRFTVWDKPRHVLSALSSMSSMNMGTYLGAPNTSITLYEAYCKYETHHTALASTVPLGTSPTCAGGGDGVGLVSKGFFEKCIIERAPNAIHDNPEGVRMIDLTRISQSL